MTFATIACPACAEPVPGGMRFCGWCGSPLTEPIEAPGEERRLVTAVFCDLVGFTPLTEQLDPEEVRDIQAAYFSAMSTQITRYGGMVEKYAGDAVLALFGAPLAHEDDAERAVLCGLGMQAAIQPVASRTRERWNVGLAIRIGVNTGEVVSGTWDASGRQDVAVTGDAVNTAARIETAAEPGEVLVGAETMRMAERRIRFGPRRDLSLKGKTATVAAYPVVGVRERLAERWETRSGRTPLTGRDRQLDLLVAGWQRAQAGQGQLISLVGDAGVGKSRLVNELVEKSTNPAQVARGRCLSYGQYISLWLVADLVRALFGICEADSVEARQTKLSQAITALFEPDGEEAAAPERQVAIDVLAEMLGASAGGSIVGKADAQVRRQALIRSLQLVLRGIAGQAPMILVLEDLHWVDPASADVLKEVLIDVPELPLLVLALQRPGWIAPWTEWGWPERLNLEPIEEQDTALLARAVLGGAPLAQSLENYVHERTGGNPYVVEELLRALQETGGLVEHEGQVQLVPGAAEQVPATLTGILLARLDRLDPEARSVAQVASVIGRSFAARLLAQVVKRNEAALQTPLASLQRAEIAFPRRTVEQEYVFKHATVREVAYNTLLKKRRQQIHVATARAIAALYPSDEYAEVIAYHLSNTTEWSEAAEWLERAGDRAADVYSNATAIKHYQDARLRLEHVEAHAASYARVDEKLGAVLTTVGQYDLALAVLEKSAESYRAVDDAEGEARVLGQVGQVQYQRGSSEAGIAELSAFLERAAGRERQAAGLASVYASLTLLLFATGRYEEQLTTANQAAVLARAAADERLLARVEVSRALALLALGQRGEAQRVLEEALPLAEAAGDLESLTRALDNLSNVHYFRGEFDRSRGYLERGLELAEQMGDPAMIGHMLFMLGTNAVWVGSWSKARTYFERDMTIVRSLSKARISALPLFGLGQLALYEGEWETATGYLEQVVQLAEDSGNLPILKWAHRMLVERELREGDPHAALARLAPLLKRAGLEHSATLLAPLAEAQMELGMEPEAASSIAEAIARATADEDRIDLAYALRASAMLAIRQHRRADAHQTLDQALDLVRQMNVPYSEAYYLTLYGVLYKEQGATEEARARFQEALTIFHRLGAKRDVERVQAAIAHS